MRDIAVTTQAVLTDDFYSKFGLSNNPFSVKPLEGQEIDLFFAGRQNEIKRAARAIRRRENVLFHGHIGNGKTTMLRFFEKEAEEQNLLAVRTDAASTERKFWVGVLESLSEKIAVEGLNKKVRKYKNAPGLFLSKSVIRDIKLTATKIKKKDFPLVLFVDEFQLVFGDRDLEASLCQEMFNDDFIFVCAGMTHVLSTKSALLERFNKPFLDLRPLRFQEVEELIIKRLDSVRIKEDKGTHPFSKGAVKFIYQCADEGNPRAVNSLCSHSLEEALEQNADEIDEEIVRKCAEKDGMTFEQRLIKSISGGGMTEDVFEALRVQIREGRVPRNFEIAKQVCKSESTVTYHLNKLIAAGLVGARGLGRGRTYFLKNRENARD